MSPEIQEVTAIVNVVQCKSSDSPPTIRVIVLVENGPETESGFVMSMCGIYTQQSGPQPAPVTPSNVKDMGGRTYKFCFDIPAASYTDGQELFIKIVFFGGGPYEDTFTWNSSAAACTGTQNCN